MTRNITFVFVSNRLRQVLRNKKLTNKKTDRDWYLPAENFFPEANLCVLEMLIIVREFIIPVQGLGLDLGV